MLLGQQAIIDASAWLNPIASRGSENKLFAVHCTRGSPPSNRRRKALSVPFSGEQE